MVKIVPTPDWFLGADVIIEAFSFIVLLIFSILSLRNYKVSKNPRFKYLGWGFGLVALAQLAALITKLVLYFDIGPSREIGQAIITAHLVSSVNIFYYMGFFFQRFLTLVGFYIIYRLPRERKSIGDYILVIYFILLSALLSTEVGYLYHLTALLILGLLTAGYYEIYRKNKYINTKILLVAFGLLFISQLVLIIPGGTIYAIGNIIELISYTILLGLIIRIRKHGTKTGSYGHNLGHAGNNSRKGRKH